MIRTYNTYKFYAYVAPNHQFTNFYVFSPLHPNIPITPGLRHEEIPIEREPRAAPRLSGPAAPGDAVPVRRGVRQVRKRNPRLSNLGADHQCGRHGHAQEQTAAR